MTTPKSEVITNFHTEFQSPTALDSSLENQFLLKAVADFELNLYEVNYDSTNETFNNDLNQIEKSALGKLMYKHYLSRERDRVLKLNNIVGKDIKLTSMADSKRTIMKTHEELELEIDKLFSRMKNNSFE